MKISLPEGFEIPENAVPGKPFEVVATIVRKEDGSFDLVAIDGIEIEESSESEENEEPEEEDYMTRRASEIRMPWPED